MPDTPLGREIAELIRQAGPITVERYMALCLAHPVHGYYRTRDPLGAAGDFTTAPEISQMFGELLGLWVAEAWSAMGRPPRFMLAELGPGRGTLMADALRALRVLPACRGAVALHLVETSPVLIERQRRSLEESGVPATWHDAVGALPPGPAIIIANEFLDALPIRQFVRGNAGWHERLIGLGGEDRLAFGLMAEPERALAGLPGEPGDTREFAAAATAVVGLVAERLALQGGAALFVDYGHARTATGDTFQALARHEPVDPLAAPGEADLTAHVDFEAIGHAARAAGASLHGPATQSAFLRALGIAGRAERLSRGATRVERDAIEAALERLTGTGPDAMGALFKVLAISDPSLGSLPGLPLSGMPARATAREVVAC